jgi:cell division protease FtsH
MPTKNIKNNKKILNKNMLPKVPTSNNPLKNIFVYLIILFLIYTLGNTFNSLNSNVEQKPLGEILKLIKEDKVQNVIVAGDKIEVLLQDGTKINTEKESTISFDEILSNNQIDTSKIVGEYKIEHRLGAMDILNPLLMFAFPLLILFFIFKQVKGANGDIMSFARSKAKLFNKGQSKITFEDVAGIEEAKSEMKEIVDFLKNPKKYQELGARIPRGILLVGPSGVGKTLLAKAIAGEADVPFFSAAGSEFMEMLVGVGSSRVRDLFAMARAKQPSLIFIDEVDAIGRQRGMGIGGGHDEREQTLNQILTEMDGFDTRTNVIVLAATNRPDMLDPALVRPGRFDRRITIPLPDLKAREEIIKIHMKGKPFADDFSIEKTAKKTVGFSGADLENMLNESAILAARANRKSITGFDMEEASLKVTMGAERKTLMTPEEKKITAFHEAGHAVVAFNAHDMDAVSRVTIIPRGGSLGHTSFPPDRDRYNESQTRLKSIIATMLGGRAAEELVFNELTIGASNDIDRATKLARQMVTEYGMSSLGPVSYSEHADSYWLARGLSEGPKYSQNMASKIDEEVKSIIDEAYKAALKSLKKDRAALDRVSEVLLEKETLDGDEFRDLVEKARA